MLLGKVLSIVAASAALLDGSMKAAMPDKNMEGTMFLINRQHAVSEFFVPETLRKVEATGMSQSMREDAATALEEMFAACKEEAGVTLVTVSGYRSYQKQKNIYNNKLKSVGGSEEIEVDIRIVAATNKDLMPLVQAGTFREDLYYRLNVVHIPIPPLRERREDIPLLVAHFAEKAAKENGIPPKTFSTEALNHLSGYEWPGNIRQLQNVVERCLVLVPGDVITLEDLPAEIRDEEAQFKSAVDLLPVQLDLADTLERIEAALIRRALVRADFVQAKAAELLGISKSLMQYKLKKYSITGH